MRKVFAHVIAKNKRNLFARTIFSNHACPAEHVMVFLIESRYGKTYFWNPHTGESRWECPDANVPRPNFLKCELIIPNYKLVYTPSTSSIYSQVP